MGREHPAALHDRARSSHQLTTCGAATQRQPSVLLFSSAFAFPESPTALRIPSRNAVATPRQLYTALYGLRSGQGVTAPALRPAKKQVPASRRENLTGTHTDNYLTRRKG